MTSEEIERRARELDAAMEHYVPKPAAPKAPKMAPVADEPIQCRGCHESFATCDLALSANGSGNHVYFCPPCYALKQAEELKRLYREAEEREAERARFLAQQTARLVADFPRKIEQAIELCTASIPKGWDWANVNVPEFKTKVSSARIRAFAEKWATGSVLLLGRSGSGKTSGCVALVNRLIDDCKKRNMESLPTSEYEAMSCRSVDLGILSSLNGRRGTISLMPGASAAEKAGESRRRSLTSASQQTC